MGDKASAKSKTGDRFSTGSLLEAAGEVPPSRCLPVVSEVTGAVSKPGTDPMQSIARQEDE